MKTWLTFALAAKCEWIEIELYFLIYRATFPKATRKA